MKLYVTADFIGTETGGGQVTRQECSFLGQDVLRLDRSVVDPEMKMGPFDVDRACRDYLDSAMRTQEFDHAHLYAGTFTETIRYLKSKGMVVSYTCPAHDIQKSREECEKLGLPFDFPHLTDPELWGKYVGGYLEADLVICPSRSSARLMESYGCKNVLVIPHGFSFPFPTRSFARKPKWLSVGYLGQVGPDKGLIYLLQAWKNLGYLDSLLRIGGSSSIGFLPWIRKWGGGNINVLGFIHSVADFYQETNVYVQPSVTEGFGIEVLEAMNMGCVVVVSEGAGAADVIENGIDGFVVPARSPEAIADRIQWIRDHPKEAKQLSIEAVRKSLDYTWDKIKGHYLEAWRHLVHATV